MNRHFTKPLAVLLVGLVASLAVAQDDQKSNSNGKQERSNVYPKNFDEYSKLYRQNLEANAYNAWLKSYNRNLEAQDYGRTLENYARFAYQDPNSVSKYWMGVQCVPAGKVKIKSEIASLGDLYKEGGLRINSITKNSPASKSGLKKGDVILVFNKTVLTSVKQLTSLIDKAKTETCKLKVVREGKVMDVSLSPKKRPEQKKASFEWMVNDPKKRTVYWDLNPGDNRVAWLSSASFSEDVEISMSRKGNQNPVIVIKEKSKSWTVRDGKIEEIPKKYQAYVARVYAAARKSSNDGFQSFNRYPVYWDDVQSIQRGYYRPQQSFTPSTFEYSRSNPKSTEQAIKDLTKTVRELQKSVKELQKK